jgi:hypothetical protein
MNRIRCNRIGSNHSVTGGHPPEEEQGPLSVCRRVAPVKPHRKGSRF